MANIILLYQHIGRELFSIKKLERILRNKGNSVYVFSIDFEIHKAIKVSRKVKIDAVVTPWMYHTRNYEEFVPFIKNNPKIKIINLHQEQITSKYAECVALPMRGVASDCVYHLCWGNDFKNQLIKCGVKENLIAVTGNMRNDEIYDIKSNREDMGKTYGLDTQKKWILFAENRNWVNMWTDAMKYEWICKGISSEVLDDYYLLNKMAFDLSLKNMNMLETSFFEKYELIYRPHPGAKDTSGLNSMIKIISQKSIYEWLNVVDCCIVWTSTSAFEADAMEVPVAVFEVIENKPDYKISGLNQYTVIKSISEVDGLDFEEMKKKQIQQKVYKDYYGEIDGNSTKRVANAIEDILARTDDGYKAKLVSRHITLKQIVYRWVLFVMIKIGIFDLIKFPRSAYAHKNDIPFYKNNYEKIKS